MKTATVYERRVLPNGDDEVLKMDLETAKDVCDWVKSRREKLQSRGFEIQNISLIEFKATKPDGRLVHLYAENLGPLTRGQVSERSVTKDPVPTPPPPPARPAKVKDGYYTVVLRDGKHYTYRISTQAADARFAPGKRVIGYLMGNDNEKDYVSFGFVLERTNGTGYVAVWKSKDERIPPIANAWILFEDPAKCGEAYAMASNRCCRCNRTLTVPASINRGMGPECASKA